MKICLIHPYFLEQRIHEEEISAPPIGIYYVGAVLKAEGHDVDILNWYNIQGSLDEATALLREKEPQLVGFSVLHANRWGAIRLARLVKEVVPEAWVVFGGVGATFLWKHLLKNFREIDVVVTGEAEATMLELVRAIEQGDREHISSIKGLTLRKNGKIVFTGKRPLIGELDTLPDPARFFTFQHVVSSRGCPWDCTFCGSPRFWGKKVRYHSPHYFVDQLGRLFKKGVSFFYVSDDTFTIKKKRVLEICNEIIERGLQITWQAISRVNYVDREVLYWMRKAGCIQISYGVESGSPTIRKRLNKQLKEKEIERAFSSTKAHGILPRAYFIYGSPGESKKTIKDSIALIRKIKPLSAIFYILDIFPGTRLYEDFKIRSRRGDEIWLQPIEDIMYHQTDPKLSNEMVLQFGQMLREAFYSSLPDFVRSLELVDSPDLAPFHADFLSRLGMTFSHGEYSQNPLIPDPEGLAQELFIKSLSYFPDHRAYLGLAILKQKSGDHSGAIEILREALGHHPQSEQLHICLAVSFMNLGQLKAAIDLLERFPNSPEALRYLANCYGAAGYKEKERICLERLDSIKPPADN